MTLVQDDDVIEALASDRSDQSLDVPEIKKFQDEVLRDLKRTSGKATTGSSSKGAGRFFR